MSDRRENIDRLKSLMEELRSKPSEPKKREPKMEEKEAEKEAPKKKSRKKIVEKE
jgi:hypothetical protein